MHTEKKDPEDKKGREASVWMSQSKGGQVAHLVPRGMRNRQSQPQKRLRGTFKAAELTPLLQSE